MTNEQSGRVVRRLSLDHQHETIPMLLHFIWMQGQQHLEKKDPHFSQRRKHWIEHLSGYQQKVWSADTLRPVVKSVCSEALAMFDDPDVPPAFKSDIGRFCLLFKFGGVYVDVDVRPIRDCRHFFEGGVRFMAPRLTGGVGLTDIFLLGSVPGHAACLDFVRAYARNYGDLQNHKHIANWGIKHVDETMGALDRHLNDAKANFVSVGSVNMYCAAEDCTRADQSVLRKSYSAATIRAPASSWKSLAIDAGARVYDTAEKSWMIIIIILASVAFVSIVIGAVLSWLVFRYRKCCFRGKGCIDGNCS